jgi:ABC-type phosphate transport system permease subunit
VPWRGSRGRRLLFTSFNNQFWSASWLTASLTVQIFSCDLPRDDLPRQAWAGTLVLVSPGFLFSVLARTVTRRLERMHGR